MEYHKEVILNLNGPYVFRLKESHVMLYKHENIITKLFSHRGCLYQPKKYSW